MAFDAGSIIAHLDLDERAFDRKLREAENKQRAFERRTASSPVRLGVSPQETSQLRRQMEQLDRQLTQDAIRRSNSGQGSVLATLLGMSSPSAARAQANQQAQAQRSVVSRLLGGFGGGGGHSNIAGGSGGGGGFAGSLARGIGPGILGLGLRATGIAGAAGLGLGALPALAGGLAPLGVAGLGAGLVSSLGSQAISGITPLLQAQQQARAALAAATTPQQRQAAQRQLAGVQQALGQQSAPLQSIFHSISSLQSRWQSFTASLAPMLVGPLRLASRLFGGLEQPIRQAFSGAMTMIGPLIRGLASMAREVLPLLGRAFRATAPLLGPLLGGLTRLLTGLLPGLITLLHAAQPAVRAVASVFTSLGSGIGRMLTSFTPVIRASSTILTALGKVLAGLFPIIGSLAAVMARTLAPIFVQLAGLVRALEPVLLIIGRVFASLAKAILGDLVAAFTALVRLIIDIRPSLTILAQALGQVFTVLENSGVFAVLGNVLEKLVPIIARLVNQVVKALAPALPPLISAAGTLAAVLATGLATAVSDLLVALTPLLVLAARLVTMLVLWLQHTHLLVPAIGLLTAAWLLFSGAFTVTPIGLMIAAIGLLVIAVVELVKHWHTVWSAIKQAAADAWNFLTHGWGQFLVPGLTLIRMAVQLVADHWHQAWTDMTNWAVDAWHFIDNDVFHPIQRLFGTDFPSWLDSAHQAWSHFWNLAHDLAVAAWHLIYNDVWAPLRNILTSTVGNWFGDAVRAIGSAWNAIRGVVEAPIRFVIDHVLDGLISAFDWITSHLGLGKPIPQVHPMGLATGGRIPGYGGGDRHLALLEGGEAVVSKETTARHADTLASWGVPGFQGGGLIGGIGHALGSVGHAIGSAFSKGWDVARILTALATGNTTALSNAFYALMGRDAHSVGGATAELGRMLAAIPRALIHDAIHFLIGSFTSNVSGGLTGGVLGAFGSGVAQWRGVALDVLRMLGQPAGDIGVVLSQMQTESGGNPLVVNKWDSNWLAGHPSVGLMQVIAGTFDAYAGRFRNTGPFEYGVSVNPLANIYAGLNYAIHRYGAGWTSVLGHGHGYDLGGWLNHGQFGLNMTGKPEAVLTPAQSSALVALAESLRLSQANSGPGYTTGIEAKLERVIRAIERSSAVTGGAVADAINGASRSSFYRANYSARGV